MKSRQLNGFDTVADCNFSYLSGQVVLYVLTTWQVNNCNKNSNKKSTLRSKRNRTNYIPLTSNNHINKEIKPCRKNIVNINKNINN